MNSSWSFRDTIIFFIFMFSYLSDFFVLSIQAYSCYLFRSKYLVQGESIMAAPSLAYLSVGVQQHDIVFTQILHNQSNDGIVRTLSSCLAVWTQGGSRSMKHFT